MKVRTELCFMRRWKIFTEPNTNPFDCTDSDEEETASTLQLVVRFQNPIVSEIPFFLGWIPFQVPKPRISDSSSKTFLDFGIRIILHLI